MRLLSIIIVLSVMLIGASFAIINSSEVTLNYFIGHADIPLSVLLVMTLITGFLLGVVSMIGKVLHLKRIAWLDKMNKSSANLAKSPDLSRNAIDEAHYQDKLSQ